VHGTIDGNCVGLSPNANPAAGESLMRIALMSVSALVVFLATASWLYFIVGFALWMFVFGDDSTTFGYYALAIAVPLAAMLTGVFITAAIRWPFNQTVLGGSIAAALILEVLFVVAIRS
jgi:hypothetical protein